MNIHPIGYIRQQAGRFFIEIDKNYREALTELDGFSHLQLLWWGHLADTPECRRILISDKPYQQGPDKIGVFANRSPMRPNPISISVVEQFAIDHEQGTIEINWIDAEPDTPLLDIKPYHPCIDRVKTCRVPEWCADWPQWYEDSASYDWSKVFSETTEYK